METTNELPVPLDEAYMLAVLETVRFGHWNQAKHFVADLKVNGVSTDRQRWWLCKLVHRHRKQHNNSDVLAMAEAWLTTHGAAFEPVKNAPLAAPTHPVQAATLAQEPPTLF